MFSIVFADNIHTSYSILELKKSDLKVTYKPYSADDARALVQNRIGSAVKAKAEIGFEYKYSLSEGLLRLIDWREMNKTIEAKV